MDSRRVSHYITAMHTAPETPRRPLAPELSDAPDFVLRAATPAHVRDLSRLIAASRAGDPDRRAFWRELPRDEDVASYLVESPFSDPHAPEYPYLIFAAGELVGALLVGRIDWAHERAELGYYLDGRATGRGYAARALKLVERHLFDLGLHRLELHCLDRNERGKYFARRNGYRLDGTLRDFMRLGEERHDVLIFSKLREEHRV